MLIFVFENGRKFVLIAIVFILGYLLIALEHPLKVDKAATALLTGVICWVLVIYGKDTLFGPDLNISYVEESITFHLGEISAILFFLLAAMTIVELIDAYHGFEVVTSKIRTTSRVKLLWIICLTTFFFFSGIR